LSDNPFPLSYNPFPLSYHPFHLSYNPFHLSYNPFPLSYNPFPLSYNPSSFCVALLPGIIGGGVEPIPTTEKCVAFFKYLYSVVYRVTMSQGSSRVTLNSSSSV
jgi:hypothetical protein